MNEGGDEKRVLTFFYRVPVGEFNNRVEFGQAVGRRIQQALINRHVVRACSR